MTHCSFDSGTSATARCRGVAGLGLAARVRPGVGRGRMTGIFAMPGGR
jgi:hypothetical protein